MVSKVASFLPAVVAWGVTYQQYQFHKLQKKKLDAVDQIELCHRMQILSLDDSTKLHNAVRDGLDAKRTYKAINEEIEENAIFRLFSKLFIGDEHGYFYDVVLNSKAFLKEDKIGLMIDPYGWNSFLELHVASRTPNDEKIAKELFVRSQHLLAHIDEKADELMFFEVESEAKSLPKTEVDRLKGLSLEAKKQWIHELEAITQEIDLLHRKVSSSLEASEMSSDLLSVYEKTLDSIKKQYTSLDLKLTRDREQIMNQSIKADEDLERVSKLKVSKERMLWSLQNMERLVLQSYAVQNAQRECQILANPINTVSAIMHAHKKEDI